MWASAILHSCQCWFHSIYQKKPTSKQVKTSRINTIIQLEIFEYSVFVQRTLICVVGPRHSTFLFVILHSRVSWRHTQTTKHSNRDTSGEILTYHRDSSPLARLVMFLNRQTSSKIWRRSNVWHPAAPTRPDGMGAVAPTTKRQQRADARADAI